MGLCVSGGGMRGHGVGGVNPRVTRLEVEADYLPRFASVTNSLPNMSRIIAIVCAVAAVVFGILAWSEHGEVADLRTRLGIAEGERDTARASETIAIREVSPLRENAA